METIEFKPKYDVKVIVSFFIMISVGWFIVIYLLINGIYDLELFLSGIFLAIFIFIFPFIFYKKISFQEYIKIDRYFIPPRIIHFDDIKDIGLNAILTSKGKILIQPMKNGNELVEIFSILQSKNLILEQQLEGVLALKEIISYKAALISIPVTILLLIVFSNDSILPIIIDLRLKLLTLYLISFSIVYLIMIKKLKSKIKK